MKQTVNLGLAVEVRKMNGVRRRGTGRTWLTETVNNDIEFEDNRLRGGSSWSCGD